jgi:hypothetical protein
LPRTRGRLARQHPGAAGNIQDAITALDLGRICHDRGPRPKQRRNEQRLVGGCTDVGGELLTIEAAMMPGKGKMTVTGNLRDVMKESISAAASYVRMRAVAFGIKPPLFDKRDIHVHVPEGATPKDGPSAGVAMVTAIVSVMTGIPVRRDLAMTAGLKEKLLAALRGGICNPRAAGSESVQHRNHRRARAAGEAATQSAGLHQH